jgi:hypothetical protein
MGLALSAAALLAASVTVGPPAGAASGRPMKPLSVTGISGWRETGHYLEDSIYAGEGVATVTGPARRSHEIYRGIFSVPKTLAAQGWGHIGDPDSAAGVIIDSYQGPGSGHTKMFLVTESSGATFEYVHTLVKGELYNNSFDAISPDRQWMVAGEWNTMTHLQMYATPLLNRRTPGHGGNLPLSGYIRLSHKVNDIQGCDFTTATMLICASDDDSQTLFTNQKPLLAVELAHRLTGRTVTARVVDLGSIPQQSSCTGTFEAEGVDYDVSSGILRVEIIQPGDCIVHTTIYEYAHQG